jgi:hypothetical protein
MVLRHESLKNREKANGPTEGEKSHEVGTVVLELATYRAFTSGKE